MHTLIVDGHSVIFAWPELRTVHQRRRAFAREMLVKCLTEFQDATQVHVALVFDGKGERATEETLPGGIQIFYSGAGETADRIIERLVAKYAADRPITVATDDALEQQTVSAFGAEWISCESLRQLLEETASEFQRTLRNYLRSRP